MAEGFDADEWQVCDEAGVRGRNQYRWLSSKTGVSEPKSWAVKQFRAPTRFRVLEMSNCQTPLSGDI